MDRKRIRKEIVQLINEVRRYESLLADTEKELEKHDLDMIMQVVDDLHQRSIVLGYLNTLQAAVQRGEVNAVPEMKEISEPELIRRTVEMRRQEAHPIKLEEVPEITGGINQEQVKMPGDDKLLEKTEIKPAEMKETRAEAKPEVKADVKPSAKEEPAKLQKQTEIDLFSGEMPAVNKPEPKPKEKEKQKPAEDKSLARKLQKKPIADLKAAIGINEKFQYINELFEGNMTEYNIAVNQLNICSSHAEAEVYLNTLRELYKWDKESETAIAFSELVERRFL